MKKFQKICAVLTALVLGLVCFAACSNGNDDGGSSDNGGNVSNNGGGNTNNGGGNTNNGGGNSNNGNTNEEEVVRVTVVAEYKDNHGDAFSYKFYSDGTYEFFDRKTVIEKGKYYGGSPKQRATLTMSQEYKYNNNSSMLLPENRNYEIYIYKEDDMLELYDDDFSHCTNYYNDYYGHYYYLLLN